jgi:hypothetical protein
MSRRRRQANAAWRITGRLRADAVTVVKIFERKAIGMRHEAKDMRGRGSTAFRGAESWP